MRVVQAVSRVVVSVVIASALACSTAPPEPPAPAPVVVEDGKTISLEYTLTLGDGSVADSNVDGEPLSYVQGGGQILPALEAALAGMQVGDAKTVTIAPEDGYGLVDPLMVQAVPIEMIPEDARYVGAQLMSQDDQGNRRVVEVFEVNADTIVVDLNHPLAGETLTFDIRIVGIE